MATDSSVKGIARWVALAALFLVPTVPLVVTESFFFPFISGKAFLFRSLVEISFVAWVVLALTDRAYRPRFSWIGVLVLAFVSWMCVADVSAANVTKAFWSNFERMEGWVLLAHLGAFFFVASSVLRVEKKWRAWFLASLAVSVILVFHALFQLAGVADIHQGSTRIDASFGNSAYFAVYLLFSACIAAWLALTEEKKWLRNLLVALAIVEGVLIFFTETRGTILGLIGALFLAALLTVATQGKRVRGYAALALAALLVVAGTFYLARDSAFVENNSILRRIASISLADGETRFTIWRMAYEGFRERPILGWGQEGFNYVFNTYYDPSLFRQEPWFDRAHNTFIDWLMAGGLPAFLLYISLFLTAVVLLWKSTGLSFPERIALTAALAGYACHNFFVFDNLYSYVYFFAILALVDSQVGKPIAVLEKRTEWSSAEASAYAAPIALVAGILLVWWINISGMRVSAALITALTPSQSPLSNLAVFRSLLEDPPFAAQEIREQLVSVATAVAQSQAVSAEHKRQVTSFAVAEMQKQVAATPADARSRLQLSYAYRTAGDSAKALEEARAALEYSPRKQSMMLEVGALLWDQGDVRGAEEYFRQAFALSPQFSELAAYVAAAEFATGKVTAAEATLTKAFGTTSVDHNVLMVAYHRTKDWPRLISLWKLRVEAPGASPQTHYGLAVVYYTAGQKENALAQVRATIARFPDTRATGESLLAQMQAGAQ